MTNDLIAEIRKHANFSNEDAKIIEQHLITRHYQKGEFFSTAGKITREIGFVVSGVFRFYAIDEVGQEVTYFFFKETDLFTELTSFHDEVPCRGHLVAETDAEVRVISKDSWKILRETVKEWDFAMRRISQEGLLYNIKFHRRLIMQNALQSYRDFLRIYPTVAQRVEAQHIASYLGITRHSLSRIKRNLSSKNKS